MRCPGGCSFWTCSRERGHAGPCQPADRLGRKPGVSRGVQTWLIGFAIVAVLMLLGAWLDRPLPSKAVCGTDMECEATLSADEREREFRANVNREAKARN